MKLRTMVVHTGLTITLAAQVGCAMFRAGELPPIESWPPAAGAETGSLNLSVGGHKSFEGNPAQPAGALLKTWTEATTRAYEDSKLFSSVAPGSGATDRRVEVHISDRARGSMGAAFVTGLTLYLVPSRASDELTVSTTVRDRDGNLLGTYSKSETVTLWQQFFLLFAMPVKFPRTVVNATIYDLSRATIVEAHAAGVL